MESKKLRLDEIVAIVVIGAAIGVLWIPWSIFYDILRAPFEPFGVNKFFEGFWCIGATLAAFIIRKPGAAILGEMVAGFVEMTSTHWGITALLWAAVQGLGAEFVFFLFRYRKWNKGVMFLAGGVSGLAEYALEFVFYGYGAYPTWLIASQMFWIFVGGGLLAGIVSVLLANSLARTGVLNKFFIVQKE